jgi:hypothetical protein
MATFYAKAVHWQLERMRTARHIDSTIGFAGSRA